MVGSSAEASISICRVEPSPGVAAQRPPAGQRGSPRPPLRCSRPSVQVLERRVVGGDETRARAGLDGHVAEGHPRLHRQRPDRLARELEDVPGSSGDAEPGDDLQHQVLGGDAGSEPPPHSDLHGPRAPLEQTLGGQHVPHLAGPDPEGEGAERAVGAGVAVAADHRAAGLGQAELRPDDMDDALVVRAQGVQLDSELPAIPLQRLQLAPARRIGDLDLACRARRLGGCRVVHRGQREDPDGAPGAHARGGRRRPGAR